MYFKELPEILYKDLLNTGKYKEVKNFFRRVRLKNQINTLLTYTRTYKIQDGETPELVAYKFYKDSDLYWIILLVNNIINIKEEWPLSTQELSDSIIEKYGSKMHEIRYYETLEIKNSSGEILLKNGIIVNSNFVYKYYDTGQNITLSGSQVVKSITNFEHEDRINENKTNIFIPRNNEVSIITDEFERLIKYDTDYGIDSSGRRMVDV